MSAPLPDALRARFQTLIEEGLSGRAAAWRLKLSPATGARWGFAIRQTRQVDDAPHYRDVGHVHRPNLIGPDDGQFAEMPVEGCEPLRKKRHQFASMLKHDIATCEGSPPHLRAGADQCGQCR